MQTDPNSDPFFFVGEAGLRRYAEVLIHCGLGHGAGIRPGETVLLSYNQASAPLVPYVQTAVTHAGGHLLPEPEIEFQAGHGPRDVLVTAGSEAQLKYLPLEPYKALYAKADHRLALKAPVFDTPNPHLGQRADTTRTKITQRLTALQRQFRGRRWQSYCLAYFPTEAMARQSGVTLEVFWEQVIKACFLDKEDAVEQVRASQYASKEAADTLTALKIRRLHVAGDDIDLQLDLDASARFASSLGGNLPSFECFTVPIADSVEGWVRFAHPFLYENTRIEDLFVRFERGKVVEWSVSAGEQAFKAMLKQDGMDRIGEFALTDRRLSRIDTILPGAMMYLENIGATGHFAFGGGKGIAAKCFRDPKHTPGMNDASGHQDAVFSGAVTVTATLTNGTERVIYQDGEFPFLAV